MKFSDVLNNLGSNSKFKSRLFKRADWKENEFIFLVNGSVFEVNRAPLNEIFPAGTKISYNPHIDKRNADGTVGVWNPSQQEILADDWEEIMVIEEREKFSKKNTQIKRIFLYNLEKSTEQEVFDWAVACLFVQKEKSLSWEGDPVFRGENGCRCPAGWLMSDFEYSPEFEQLYWGALVKGGFVPNFHEQLITRLQEIHDKCDVSDWKRAFETVAKDYGLEWKFEYVSM